MKRLLIIFICSILIACSSKNNISIVLKYRNKQIYFPENLLIINNETQTDNNVFKSPNLKIITFINGNCSVCIEHMTYWKKFIEMKELKSNDVEFITILISQNLDTFYEINKYLKFNYSIIYDKDDVIRKNNMLNDYELTKFLLLDSDNKILLIGDPISNPKVKDIYLEVIKSYNNKN